MLTVFAYWIYLFAITSIYGIGLQFFFGIKQTHNAITPILGGFLITILGSIYALVSGLDVKFEGFLIIAAVPIAIALRKDLTSFILSLKNSISILPIYLKLFLGAILAMSVAKCAGIPFILDNESYYIQTIKWLDNYGFVKGVGNLHPFLAQHSGWHVLQSALNLDILSNNLNDINGYYLLFANFYAVDHLRKYFRNNEKQYLIIGMFPLFNVLLFQFINAPSPDLAIYLITYFMFSETLKLLVKNENESNTFILLFLLAIFAAIIKVTAILLFLFPIALYVLNRELLIRKKTWLVIVSLVAAFVFIAKNYIVSGYPFYPLSLFESTTPAWKMPVSLHNYITQNTRLYGYFLTEAQFAQTSFLQKFWHWLTLPGLHGIFNKLMTLVLLIFPGFIYRSTFKKSLTLLYILAILQYILVLFSSPQYRFFLGILILLIMCIGATLFRKQIIIKSFYLISALAIAIPLFFPISLESLTTNEHQSYTKPFSNKNIVSPHPNTRYIDSKFQSVQDGNLNYNSPLYMDFFWASGNGALPTVQKNQIDYFKRELHILPQLIGKDISEGFYSQQLPNE